MCEKEPKRRSCTTCPQYDGMKCTATDFTLGARDEVLQQEHRRGFICLDTGEAELKGDAAIQWTAEQERLSQEKGYKSCVEMWAAEGKQVKSGFLIDEDNEHLEPLLQVSCSPSSESPSLRDGPPQKGKITENRHLHNTLRTALVRNPEIHCGNCKKSHKEGNRLVCDKWGIQNILMPQRTCEKWAFRATTDLSSLLVHDHNEAPSLYKEGVSSKPKAGDLVIVPGNSICTADNVSINKRPAEDNCITYISNTPDSNAVFTDEEISQLTDALRTMQRILGQHGVTL